MMGPLEELLRDGGEPLSDVARESLTVVQRNCLRLLKLVNSLLDFSRLEAGRLQPHYGKVDISASHRGAAACSPAIERAGLSLHVDSGTIRGDVRRRRCGRSCSICCRTRSSTRCRMKFASAWRTQASASC
jgi:signal transduction histidine kinase